MENLPEKMNLPHSQNLITVDWLSVTFHDVTTDYVKALLGLDTPDIPWRDELTNRNGYPRQLSFNNIAIRYGADNADNYKNDLEKTADQKVRYDMGIQLDMSGNGCRAFGSYSTHPDWIKLFRDILSLDTKVNITRIDLAFDDRDGILPIERIVQDTRSGYWTGPAKKWVVYESGDQENNLIGRTVYIGSPSSMIRLRIYDKAAERAYSDGEKHWIRVELVLRHDRANAAAQEILDRNDIGEVLLGLLKNYCCFREESYDSNKSRWPITEYWQKLLDDVQRIRLFSAPGEEYNFKKTHDALVSQYGQALQVIAQLGGSLSQFLVECKHAHPDLKPKYRQYIEEVKYQRALEIARIQRIRAENALSYDENFPIIPGQIDMAEIWPDENNSGAAGPRYKILDDLRGEKIE